MSGIAVIYERTSAPVDAGVLVRVMRCLEHRGPHGSDVYHAGQFALGHCHFWTTPEEQGERQPLSLNSLPFTIVFDGRLDNRTELIAELGLQVADAGHLSDSALVLHAYARWGEACVKRFLGEFAFAILDETKGEVFCARDPLGDRTLFYSLTATRFTLASEPWAVAAAADSSPGMNEGAAAYYFALQVPENGGTLFRDISELLPAHAMLVGATHEHRICYWQPDLSHKIRGHSDKEYAEQFRALLEESVRCRLRSSSPVGVLMSGGLDSTSVACLAARMTAGAPLTTVSYVFDEFKSCDERLYIDAVREKYSLNSVQIPCDDLWPFKNMQDLPHNPNQPEGNPYRLLKERAYARARQEGVGILLTGGFGDHLYSDGMDWLADLLAEGKIRTAARELILYLKYAGWHWTLSAGFIWRTVRRLLDAIPLGKYLHRRRRPLAWLTPYSITQISAVHTRGDSAGVGSGNLLGLRAAQSSSSEIANANRHGLELRHPYRDRRLVEFVLALPAYQLYFRGRYKHVLRNAMQGILPEMVRSRAQPTSLAQFYFTGFEREGKTLRASLGSPDALWRRFVRSDWVFKYWNIAHSERSDGSHALVPWLCSSFEIWHTAFHSGYNKQGVIL